MQAGALRARIHGPIGEVHNAVIIDPSIDFLLCLKRAAK
jgi:hypothetical protein